MKLIIDIPDWKYKSICEGIEASKRCGVIGTDPDVHEAIYKGIPYEERPQGEWYYNCQNGWHCSLCHKAVKFMPTIMGKANFDFCPNCGAEMRKPNCVTCDHFGKCKDCEKGEEE